MSDPIIATAADGTEHEFPADTNPAVVDRAMKQYAVQSRIKGAFANKTVSNIASEAMGAADPILGLNSLLDKGFYGAGQIITSAGGLAPNPVSRWMGEAAHSGEKIYGMADKALQAQRASSGQSGFDPFRLAGNIASPVNAVMPAPTSLIDAAGTGAAYGAMQPTQEGASPLQNVANAAMGAGGGMAGYGIGKALTPGAPTARQNAVDLLRNEGIEPPIGATMGQGAHATEQKLESVPFVGGAIRKGEIRANEELNQVVYNRVLEPIGASLPPGTAPGRDAVAAVNKAVSNAYDTALNGATLPYNQNLHSDIQNVVANASTQLSERQNQLGAWVNRINETFQKNGGVIDGDTLKGLSSNLRREAQNLLHSPDDAARTLGMSVDQLDDVLLKNARAVNPGLGPALDAADQAYTGLVRLNRAAGYNAAAGTGGVFNPSQLVAAVQSSGMGRAAKASGNLPMQDLSDAAAMVLKPTMANSRTADREMAAMAAAVLTAHPEVALGAGGLWGGAHTLYSRPVTSAINSVVRGPALARMLQQAPAVSGMAGRIPPALLAQMLQTGGAGAPAYGQVP